MLVTKTGRGLISEDSLVTKSSQTRGPWRPRWPSPSLPTPSVPGPRHSPGPLSLPLPPRCFLLSLPGLPMHTLLCPVPVSCGRCNKLPRTWWLNSKLISYIPRSCSAESVLLRWAAHALSQAQESPPLFQLLPWLQSLPLVTWPGCIKSPSASQEVIAGGI